MKGDGAVTSAGLLTPLLLTWAWRAAAGVDRGSWLVYVLRACAPHALSAHLRRRRTAAHLARRRHEHRRRGRYNIGRMTAAWRQRTWRWQCCCLGGWTVIINSWQKHQRHQQQQLGSKSVMKKYQRVPIAPYHNSAQISSAASIGQWRNGRNSIIIAGVASKSVAAATSLTLGGGRRA